MVDDKIRQKCDIGLSNSYYGYGLWVLATTKILLFDNGICSEIFDNGMTMLILKPT